MLQELTESGFTKYRFQDMMQYPEKSHQCHARYDVRAIWHPLGRIFQDIESYLEPEFGETRLWFGIMVPPGEHTGFSNGGGARPSGWAPHADGPPAKKGATDDEGDFC